MSDFMHYYEAELDLQRRALVDFALAHPEKARQLGLASGLSRDPDIQRLSDGFAHVAARMQQRLDEARGEIAFDLLRAVAPRLLLGAPSHLSLQPSGREGLPAEAVQVKAGTPVPFIRNDDLQCMYTVARDTVVLPVELGGQRLETAPLAYAVPAGLTQVEGVLILQLDACVPGQSLAQFAQHPLEFYLPRKAAHRNGLGEALFADVLGVAVAPAGSAEAGHLLPREAWHPMMAEPESNFCPTSLAEPQGLELMHEFLGYPDKAFAFRLSDLSQAAEQMQGATAEIRIFLGRRGMGLIRKLDKGDITLNTLSCINLFEVSSEPYRYSFARDRMPVRVPRGNGNRPEILRVLNVTRLTSEGDIALSEIAAPAHTAPDGDPLWQERRVTGEPDLSRRDLSFSVPAESEVIKHGLDFAARLLCSNGAAGMLPRPGEHVQVGQDELSETEFVVLDEPSAAIPARLDADRRWDLAALVGGNFNVLLSQGDPTAALRGALHLCAPTGYAPEAQAIVSVAVHRRFAPFRLSGQNIISAGVLVDIVIDAGHLSVPPTSFGYALEGFLKSFVSFDRFFQLQLRENGADRPFFAPARHHGGQVAP